MFRPILLAATLALAAPAFAADPPAMASNDEVRAKLLAADADKDGKWSKTEWLAAGRQEAGFVLLDTDHDGYVTPDELKVGMAKMRAARDGKAN